MSTRLGSAIRSSNAKGWFVIHAPTAHYQPLDWCSECKWVLPSFGPTSDSTNLQAVRLQLDGASLLHQTSSCFRGCHIVWRACRLRRHRPGPGWYKHRPEHDRRSERAVAGNENPTGVVRQMQLVARHAEADLVRYALHTRVTIPEGSCPGTPAPISPASGTPSRRMLAPRRPQSGLAFTTLVASAAATAATTRAATRSAHHHPKRWSVNKPTKARIPRAGSQCAQCPVAHQGMAVQPLPGAVLGPSQRGKDQSRDTGGDHGFDGGAGCRVGDQVVGGSHNQGDRYQAQGARDKTTDARASARMPLVGSRRSTPNRHTRPIDPATSAKTLSPNPRTPRLPASSPVVTAQAPAIRPHTTERYERINALDTSRVLVRPTSASRESIAGQSCGPGDRRSLPGVITDSSDLKH